MNERDRRVIENFISTGMNLEGLYASFPKFDKKEIEELFNAYHSQKQENGEEDFSIKVNCS